MTPLGTIELDPTPPDASLLVSLTGVVKTYPGGVTALASVTLEIARGEMAAIVGPSGSGKSTMLNTIGTLDRPTSGTVRIDGYDVSALSDNQLSALRGTRIGFVFQQFHLAANVPALDNVADGLLYAGLGPAERRRRARVALERVGLGHRIDHEPHELSGGERQRVAIARALVNRPSILLADEPTGNLDSTTSEEIMAVFGELHRLGQTVIMVTHEPDIAAFAERVVVLRDGRVESDRLNRESAA